MRLAPVGHPCIKHDPKAGEKEAQQPGEKAHRLTQGAARRFSFAAARVPVLAHLATGRFWLPGVFLLLLPVQGLRAAGQRRAHPRLFERDCA
jgi:hypothetical protein